MCVLLFPDCTSSSTLSTKYNNAREWLQDGAIRRSVGKMSSRVAASFKINGRVVQDFLPLNFQNYLSLHSKVCFYEHWIGSYCFVWSRAASNTFDNDLKQLKTNPTHKTPTNVLTTSSSPPQKSKQKTKEKNYQNNRHQSQKRTNSEIRLKLKLLSHYFHRPLSHKPSTGLSSGMLKASCNRFNLLLFLPQLQLTCLHRIDFGCHTTD